MLAAPGATPRYDALLQLLRTADTLWNSSRLFFARWNLSPSQFNILNLLLQQSDGFSQIELGRLLITHRSNITGLVDRLEARGLLRRKEVAGDRRAYRIVLTPAAKKLLDEILPEYYRTAEEVWRGLPAARARLLAKDLQRITNNAAKLNFAASHHDPKPTNAD
jgi:DNA-binding MarR family transcriptional regulator